MSLDTATYVSDGRFALDGERLLGNAPRTEASDKTAAEVAAMAEELPPAAKRELLALDALARARKLPKLNRITFDLGYAVVEDVGDDLPDVFGGNETAMALARGAVGVANNGGGLVVFVLADGHVAALAMESTFEWQWARFDNLGQFCWVMLHAAAAASGTFPAAELTAAIDQLGCADAASTFGVPSKYVPEYDDSSEDPSEEPPAWLR